MIKLGEKNSVYNYETELDWKKNPRKALRKGVRVESIGGVDKYYYDGSAEGCTFCNFPNLCITKHTLHRCNFIDCGEITIIGGARLTVHSCVFERVNHITFDSVWVEKCVFRDIDCGKEFMNLKDCFLRNGRFEDVRVSPYATLITGAGESMVVKSRFRTIDHCGERAKLFCHKDSKRSFIRFADNMSDDDDSETKLYANYWEV